MISAALESRIGLIIVIIRAGASMLVPAGLYNPQHRTIVTTPSAPQ
jgi:hypothetical protein